MDVLRLARHEERGRAYFEAGFAKDDRQRMRRAANLWVTAHARQVQIALRMVQTRS